MSNFAFLQPEWPAVHEASERASVAVHSDPRVACFYARRALELLVAWVYKHDPAVRLPYQDNLGALIHEPTFLAATGEAVFAKAQVITRLGNQAVHRHGPVPPTDAMTAVRELFHVCYWLARTYGRMARPEPGIAFDAQLLPKGRPVPPQTADQLKRLEEELRARDEKLATVLADRNTLDEELKRLRAEVAEAKRAASSQPDTHDYSEAATRDEFIDLLLQEAGWTLDQERDREFPVTGMPNQQGKGFVDYVLWGDDGRPLAVVEAKRTKRDPRVGQQQAKLYADCLERQYGQRPVIFYTNGYQHWLWDDQGYPPRAVQGFLKKPELELMIQRRSTRQSLAGGAIDAAIVDRHYQERAIRRVGEAFEKDKARRALLVMATGAGKTRTVIALCDLLMRANWAKRVLFLADRVALVNQAVNAFKRHLPTCAPVNLCTEKTTEGRVYVSTYPTMMGLIDETSDSQRRFGVGHFDLIVIDEAHRSVYQRYGAIFEYFDSLLVGLTATPKSEVDHNTYKLFRLETGVPTDVYDIDDAVKDGHLVPPRAVSVPLKFQREGIDYNHLSEEEKEAWDALEWSEDGATPERVEAGAVNQWLFNSDTVDRVLEHVMRRGQKVDNGDKLGKAIVFAKNQDHAHFIEERFNENYPHYKGAFARTITFKTEYAQSLINDFSDPKKLPQIAISVDMLDTGIDVPDVVNLVFFKLVRSKTKFWQMVGRGTRLRPDLFGPGQDKEFFSIFDYCQNLEFFSQNPAATEGAGNESLSKRLFTGRLELIQELDHRAGPVTVVEPRPTAETELRGETAETLRAEVEGMNVHNFIVRPQRLYVERYRVPEAWTKLELEHVAELTERVAGLPTEVEDPDVEARQFDYLMLRLQLALLRVEPSFTGLRKKVEEIAALLSEKENIPMVRAEMRLILEIQTDEFWQDVTAPILETVRRKLRALVKLIEFAKRKPIYTNFEDEMGAETEIEFAGLTRNDFERFQDKARVFLRKHEEHESIRKIRQNEKLTAQDLAALERLLLEAGIGTAADLRQAREASEGFGLFMRSLAGLDRTAAKRAFDRFLEGRRLTANQLEFVDLMVNQVTESGWVEVGTLYESPFTDWSPRGVEGVFAPDQVTELVGILGEIRAMAASAAG